MTERDFEPRHRDMGRHIASGIVNSGMVQVIKVLCQFGSVIVLSRLLPPADFGIIAMAGPVYGFVTLFQDLGLSQATVQKPVLNQNEVSTFFWINVGVGVALTTIIFAISPLAGWYYNEPRVVPLICAMGLLILFGSTGNQHVAILTRRMEFGLLSRIGVMGAVTGLGVSIIAALILKNYWALYCGLAVSSTLATTGVWIASGWRPGLPHRVPGLREMLKFGAGVTSANITSFFSGNTDNILIGHRWGDHILGLYDRAYKLLLFPIQRIAGPVMSTLVPVLSRLTSEPERYQSVYLKTIGQLALAIWPGIVWAIVLAGTLVPTLLGRQWTDSAAIFVPLAFAGLVQTVNNSINYLYISQGRSGDLARWSLVGAIVDVTAFAIGLPYGATGVATAFAISEYLRTPFFWWNVTRRGPVRLRAVVRAVLPQAAAALASGAALIAYRDFIQAPPLVLLGGGLMLSYAVSALFMGLSASGRQTLRHTLDAARRILLHIKPMKSRA